MTDDHFNITQEIKVDEIHAALGQTNGGSNTADDQPISIEQKELIFVIRGIVERLLLHEDLKIVLGRGTGATERIHQLDLRPHEASVRGVSRQHACIELKEGQLYVTDLSSTNGTWLAGQRLTPYEPSIINKGDELVLGRLFVQVLFRTSSSGKLRP